MYLGRPHCIKLNDVSVPRPNVTGTASSLWDMAMATTWADLLEIVGDICDALYGLLPAMCAKCADNDSNDNSLSFGRAAVLNKRLQDWQAALDPVLRPAKHGAPAVFVLQ